MGAFIQVSTLFVSSVSYIPNFHKVDGKKVANATRKF